jgi:hypothetical protein
VAKIDKPLLLFIVFLVLIVASYNVDWLGMIEEKTNWWAWLLFNTSLLFCPLPFYYAGKEFNRKLWCYVSMVGLSFFIGNMVDFITGRQYGLYLTEYIAAALSTLYLTYEYRKGKWTKKPRNT